MSTTLKKCNFVQPESFEFSEDNLRKANAYIKKYPPGKQRSAVMPLLYLVQEQHNNWIPIAAMDYVANLLNIYPTQVYEVAHFYTMFYTQPVGKNIIQVCKTTPCMLRGAQKIIKACKEALNINLGETTKDRQFTLVTVECLGACVNAPLVQINNDYYENVTTDSIKEIISKRKKCIL